MLGQVAGLAVDARDHVWIIQRPWPLASDEVAKDPDASYCHPAPPVMEFDNDGNYVQGWGGEGAGDECPAGEQAIHVDYKGNVWIGGNRRDVHPAQKAVAAARNSASRRPPASHTHSQTAPLFQTTAGTSNPNNTRNSDQWPVQIDDLHVLSSSGSTLLVLPIRQRKAHIAGHLKELLNWG